MVSLDDELLAIKDVFRTVPVNPSTRYRWISSGIKGPDGKRVYLETLKVGGQRFATRKSEAAFLAALNSRSDKRPVLRSPQDRRRAAARARAELATR